MKYVVVDLEMCKVSKAMRKMGFRWSQETIQIGAVILDENYEEAGRFSTYVRPEYGRIDSFIERLTGIGPSDVMDAPTFSEAIEKFAKWVPEDACCVSWTDTDEKQIRHEVEVKNIENEKLNNMLDSWIDCQKTFNDKMDSEKNFGLEEALIASGIYQEGRAHDGLTDAVNTAKLFAKMETEEEFTLLPEYKAAHEGIVEPLSYSIGDLFSGLMLQCAAG